MSAQKSEVASSDPGDARNCLSVGEAGPIELQAQLLPVPCEHKQGLAPESYRLTSICVSMCGSDSIGRVQLGSKNLVGEVKMPDLVLGAVIGGSADLRGYIARPEGSGPWPGVVVIQELWGLDDALRLHCDRLASAGYLAFAPNLYSDGGALRCVVATFKAAASGKGKAFADIEAARRQLLAQTDCTGKVGVIGFCIGGAFALMASTRGFQAASDNYGALPAGVEEMFQGACPIIASYGAKDPLLPRNTAERLDKALTKAGVEHEVYSYPGAGHQFFNNAPNGPMILRPILKVTNSGPNPAAAAQAWERIEEFFGKHLH